MSEEKWTARAEKTTADGADEILVLDSQEVTPTPLNNKRMSLTTLNTLQSIQNVIVVRSAADFPDAEIATLDSVSDEGGLARFNVASIGTLKEGQALFIDTSAGQYDKSFILITNIVGNSFTATDLSGTPTIFTGGESGIMTRCLAFDTDYRMAVPITTANGYRMVDSSSTTLTAESRTHHKITMIGTGKTFITAKKLKFFRVEGVDVNDGPFAFANTLCDVEGTFDLVASALQFSGTLILTFGTLGIIKGLVLAVENMVFNFYNNGFVADDVQFLSSVTIFLSSGNGSTFLKINNLKELYTTLPGPITLLTPPTVNIADMQPALFANDTLLDINPATQDANSYVFTTASKTFGGQIFKPSTFTATGTITNFAASTSPTGNTTVTAINSLVTGQKVRISGSTNFNGDFIISNRTPTTFDIIRPFESGGTLTGTFQALRFISAFALEGDKGVSSLTYSDNGFNGTTVTSSSSLPVDYVNFRRVTITSTLNYNGEFKIFNVTTFSFDIQTSFFGTETSGGVGTMSITNITVAKHGLAPGSETPLLLDESINYDNGVIATEVTADELFIDLPFNGTGTGILLDGSLNGTAKNVLVNAVADVLNSKAKGSFSVNGNATATVIGTLGTFVDLILDTTKVKESSDTELFRVINKNTGEIEYRGLEPFSGQLSASISITKAASSQSTEKYTLRALRNDGIMVDDVKADFSITGNSATIPISVTFLQSVTAKTGDKFKLQITNPLLSNLDSPTFRDLTVVIQ